LQHNFQKVSSKNISLNKLAKDLSKELDDLIEEKNILEEENEDLKKMSNVDFLHEQIRDLIQEKNILEEENDDLRKKSNVDSLHEQINDLTESLSKFTKGKDGLDLLLGKQRCFFHKTGIGYNPNEHKNFYKNLFEKNPSSGHSKLTCHYCGKLGHISPSCPMKGYSFTYVNKTWVQKNQTYFAQANPHGPKMIWVPKIKS
jgi:regulator of replication initiation timing